MTRYERLKIRRRERVKQRAKWMLVFFFGIWIASVLLALWKGR